MAELCALKQKCRGLCSNNDPCLAGVGQPLPPTEGLVSTQSRLRKLLSRDRNPTDHWAHIHKTLLSSIANCYSARFEVFNFFLLLTDRYLSRTSVRTKRNKVGAQGAVVIIKGNSSNCRSLSVLEANIVFPLVNWMHCRVSSILTDAGSQKAVNAQRLTAHIDLDLMPLIGANRLTLCKPQRSSYLSGRSVSTSGRDRVRTGHNKSCAYSQYSYHDQHFSQGHSNLYIAVFFHKSSI